MVGEAVGAVVTKDDVIEQGDPEELAALPETGRLRCDLRSWDRDRRNVIVRADGGPTAKPIRPKLSGALEVRPSLSSYRE